MASELNMNPAFSADVQLRLVIGERSWRLVKIGPNSILSHDVIGPIDKCVAKVVMTVDGAEQTWDVELPDGVLPYDDESPILIRDIVTS